ncbi:UNVERIFIED_CONTAM: hypothetical protein FKN15_045133 [Acipenser sinensis]
MAPRPQKFPAFPDFMEEVRSSWDCPASGPSVLKHAAPLASLEGADKLGLAGFPPVDSTIAALVKARLWVDWLETRRARTLNCPPVVQLIMGRAAAFLQVPWTSAAEPRRSVFQTQAMAPRPQKFPAFPDFMEEVRSSWDCPASGPSMLKHAALLASLEGADKLGLAGFPPVDSTTVALVKARLVGGLARDPACPNPQCKVTETHLKRAYATRLSNTASVLPAYLDGVFCEASLPKPVAIELRLLPTHCCRSPVSKGKLLAGAWLA